MPTLKIGDKRVRVDDSFLQLSPDDQAAAVEEIAAGLGMAPAAAPAKPANTEGEVTGANVAKAALRGIPVLGAGMNQAAAAIDAATQPLFGSLSGSQAPTFAERRTANLQANQANEKAFAEESPIASTAANVAGGVGALLPAAATQVGAKLLGMSGTLPQMIQRGAVSGAALSGADAAARGEDAGTAAMVGGTFGALAPPIARGIGEGVRAVRRAVQPAAAPVAQNTVSVGNAEIPMTQSQMTGNAAQSAEEQIIARGARGTPAQEVAEQLRAQQQAGLRAAGDEIVDTIAPGGARVTPQAAAEAVSTELTGAQQAAERARQAAQAAAAQEGAELSLAAGGGRTVADAPYTAAEIIGTGVRGAAQTARQARTAAYQAAREAEIEVSPAAFDRMPQAVQSALNAGEDRVRLNTRTPSANEAMQIMRNGFGATDQGSPPMRPGPDGRPQQRPVTGTDIDEMRKDLIQLQRQANSAARGPGGDATDQRAMQRILRAFDDHVERAVEAGTVSGDGQEFLRRLREARRLHGEYRSTFGPRDAQDEVGKVIEKIVGRGDEREALPDKIAGFAYGTQSDPGGQLQVRVAQRLNQMFGPDSREVAAHKQGLLAYLTEAPPGATPYTPAQVASRVEKFLTGTKGRGLAEEVFSDAERGRLARYAAQSRAAEPAEAPRDVVTRAIARIAGADGQLPATVNEIVGMLYGSNSTSVPLAKQLKLDLTPESWNKVRLGLYSHLTEVPEGMIAKKEQALSQRLHQFLNGEGKELAETMFTQRERNLLGQMADAYKRMIPVEGTTNPSGTAPMLTKIVAKVQGVLLPLLGFSHGGMVGAGLGVAAQKGLEHLSLRKSAKDAITRFYGEQPRAAAPPANTSRVPQLITQGSMPALTN